MKLFKLGLLLSCTLSLSGQEVFQCKDFNRSFPDTESQPKSLQNFHPNPLTQNFDLKYQRLELSVDPSVNYIKGTVTSYFLALEDELDMLRFVLADNIQIKEVN